MDHLPQTCTPALASSRTGYLYGVPIIRIIVLWGLYWGPLVREMPTTEAEAHACV